MPPYYPVFLDLRGRRCVVIGGGPIGEEKVERLVDFGADVVVFSPKVTRAVRAMAEEGPAGVAQPAVQEWGPGRRVHCDRGRQPRTAT